MHQLATISNYRQELQELQKINTKLIEGRKKGYEK